jgi:hypothetical protein
MTSKHEEFPELTHQAKCVLNRILKIIDVSEPHPDRRFAAAVIREAMTQTGTWHVSEDFPAVIRASELRAIADNLHALPPPPPTRERMEEALSSLFGQIVCHPESQFAQEAAILAAGIAHYCSPTP